MRRPTTRLRPAGRPRPAAADRGCLLIAARRDRAASTTRGRPPIAGRRLPAVVAAVALAAIVALALAAPARAGTFRFSQCAAAEGGGGAPRGYQGDLWRVEGGFPMVDCGMGGGRIRIGTSNWRLPHYGRADAVFGLPGSLPGTSIRTAWLDWTSMPQSPSRNPAYFLLTSSGARLVETPTGSGTHPGAAQRVVTPTGARSLRFSTWCSPANGPGWCSWPGHLFELRGMTLELEESREPAATAAGPLVAPGPRAGVEPLEVSASDADSGVRRVAVLLGGTPVGSLTPAAGCREDRLPPCPRALRGTVDVDTRRVPDGTHGLRLVVTDAAGNVATVDRAAVRVVNQPPVDTPAPPPVEPGGTAVPVAPVAGGRPAFPPNPLAGRGHAPNGRNASERARVRAWLELVRPGGAVLRRRAVTVRPGVRVRIRGRVTDPRGRPIGRAILAAVRREPGGPWRPITGVRTRANGRFTAFTRIGPSQQVRFVYYAYGDSRRGVRSPVLRVTVRR